MTNKVLLTSQIEEIIESYVEIVVDRFDTQELIDYVTEDLTNRYYKMTTNELKEWIYEHEDEYLYDELVENVQIEDVNKQWQDFQEIKDNRQIGDRF